MISALKVIQFCSSLIEISILESHPVPDHLSVSSAHASLNRTLDPHKRSVVASAMIFGDVVFNIDSNGRFCKNFSLIPSKQSFPFFLIHSVDVVAQSFTF